MSTREKMLEEINEAWRELENVLDRVPPARMEEAGVVEDWSIKDLIGHVATWENDARTRIIDYLGRGDKSVLHWQDVDAFNARTSAEKKSIPLPEILADAREIHGTFSQLVESMDEEALNVPEVEKRVRVDSFDHYREHAQHIRDWLEKIEKD